MNKNTAGLLAIVLAASPINVRAQTLESIDVHAIRMATPTPEEKITKAEGERRDMLKIALERIDATLKKEPGEDAGAPDLDEADHKVVAAVGAWLYETQVNGAFWVKLKKARALIARNQALTGTPPLRRDEENTKDYAYVKDAGDPSAGIYFTSNYMNASANCRREVQVHEYFHFVVGPQHFYSTKDPEEAIRCPHHLAELVSQIATGTTEGCSSAYAE